MKLLIDFNNLSLRNFFGIPEINAKTPDPDYKIWEESVFSSLINYLYNFKNIDEVVVGVDSGTWRKSIYPLYKGDREKRRKDDDIDWAKFYETQSNFLNELKENLPFKILQIHQAEADDIIGVLALSYCKEFTIVSRDSDYLQLSNVAKIYDPQKKEYKSISNIEKFIDSLCVCGQKKDNIYNVKTPLDWPADKRKPAMGEKGYEKMILERSLDNFLDKEIKYNFKYLSNEKEANYKGSVFPRERYEINKKLIDFREIPEEIKEKILNEYNNYKIKGNLDNLYNYFKNKNWFGAIDNFDNLEMKLREIWKK